MCKHGNVHASMSSKSVVTREEKEKESQGIPWQKMWALESLWFTDLRLLSFPGFNARPSEISCDYEPSSCQKGPCATHGGCPPETIFPTKCPLANPNSNEKVRAVNSVILGRQFKQLLFVFYFWTSPFFLQTDHNSYNIIPSSRSNNICSIKKKINYFTLSNLQLPFLLCHSNIMQLFYFPSEEVVMDSGINIPWIKRSPSRLWHLVEVLVSIVLGSDVINYSSFKWEAPVYH